MQTISFLRKRNGPHPKEKSQSGVGQSTSISGAEQYCYYWEAPLPGVTPCARAAFGAGQHPPGAPGCNLDSGVPALPCRRARPGRAPQRGPDAPRKQHHARRRRAVALPAFSHRFPAPGGGQICSGLTKGLFLWQPKPFLFGPLQKEMGSGTSRPGTGF